ncbi:MAG: hypothetical protein WBA22_08495 [Candidatus Methanofastidiosia archaeon]
MDNLHTYHQIYDQVYENPFSSVEDIAGILHMSLDDVDRNLNTMYHSSLLQEPVISVKPASQYRMYSYFLKMDNPFASYREVLQGSYISKSWAAGHWNLMVITHETVDVAGLNGVRKCVYSGKKGGTYISKCVHTDWDHAMKDIFSRMNTPGRKTVFYEEVPALSWDQEDWMLYHAFRLNARREHTPVLQELNIDCEKYRRWLSTLPAVAYIQPAFCPYGWDTCGTLDFLLKSDFQPQVVDILGLLPCSGVFFSTGDSLLARLFVKEKEEIKEVDRIIRYLLKFGYVTDYLTSLVMSTCHRGDVVQTWNSREVTEQ